MQQTLKIVFIIAMALLAALALFTQLSITRLADARPPVGEFAVVDGLRMHVWVFVADGCEGTEIETDEALPLWVDENALPYGEMWADDRVWVPEMLAGRTFRLRAVFDGDEMLDHVIAAG